MENELSPLFAEGSLFGGFESKVPSSSSLYKGGSPQARKPRSSRGENLAHVLPNEGQCCSDQVLQSSVFAFPHPQQNQAENKAIDGKVLKDCPRQPFYPDWETAFFLRSPFSPG